MGKAAPDRQPPLSALRRTFFGRKGAGSHFPPRELHYREADLLRSGSRILRKHLVPAAILVVSCAFALALAALVWRSSTESDRLRFESFADDAVGRIESRLDLHVSLLESTRAYMGVANAGRDRDSFAAFVGELDLDGRYDGIQGIGFADAIAVAQTGETASTIAASYGLDRGVWPVETDQTVRTPILLLEPQDRRNFAAIGFDMFSDATRRDAMRRAARTSRPSATAPVQLVQEIDENRQTGFLVYLPLRGAEDGTDERDAIRRTGGFVYAPFRAGDLVSAALAAGRDLPVHAKVYDTEVAPDRLLVAYGQARSSTLATDFATVREVDFAGRRWVIELAPGTAFPRTASDLPALLLALVGVALSVLMALLVLSQTRRAEAVAALADSNARSLDQKDLLLREMNHRIKNSITRILAIARQTARYSADLDAFMASFSARLAAMTTSQELLTESDRKLARIGDLLAAELGQVFGEDMRNCTLAGPTIEVDATAAQSLGLTFHELATNALKYGSVADGDGALRVEWWREGDEVAIDWIEQGKKDFTAFEPARKGFGTRLINMNIERELGGRIGREFGARGLTVRLRFPAMRIHG